MASRGLALGGVVLAAMMLFAARPLTAQERSTTHAWVTVQGELKRIEVEPFALWVPNGGVVIEGAAGVARLPPPNARYYRGQAMREGDFVFFSVDESGVAQGLMILEGKRYVLASDTDADGSRRRPTGVPRLIAQEAETNDMTAITEWRCTMDGERPARTPVSKVMSSATPSPAPESLGAQQSYAFSLEIETDYDLYVSSGYNATTLTNHVATLTGALTAILSRDMNVTLQIREVVVHSSPDLDPWHAQPSAGINAALYELGDYYHANYPTMPRSAVVLLSGKPFSAGTAWEGSLCLSPRDFQCSSGSCGDPAADGHYGGTYAVCGSMSGSGGNAPDVNHTLPATGFWELQDFAHEVGHVLGGHHTNCIALTPAEQGTTGRYWVDQCASDEYNCYSGDVLAPGEGGTIMGSCFNVSPTSSRYVYGIASDVSHHELDDYLLRSAGTVGGLPNIVSSTSSLTLSQVSAPSSVSPNSTGNVASITPVSGAVYAWSIASGTGTITAGSTTNSVTFSAPASGSVQLTVALYNAGGCAGITENKSIPVGAASAAPTGLVATAASSNSVNLVWNQVTGSSIYYTVYRSNPIDYHTFTIVGCTQQVPSSLSPFVDSSFVTGNNAYLYKVTAASGTFNANCSPPSGESAFSNVDVATTVFLPTGVPAIAINVIITADHINYLRNGVVAIHKLANAGANLSLTDPTINHCATGPCIPIKAVHINELRSALTTDRQTLSLPAISFGAALTSCTVQNPSQCVVIRATHFTDVRNAFQ
jgi:hypothetical protein